MGWRVREKKKSRWNIDSYVDGTKLSYLKLMCGFLGYQKKGMSLVRQQGESQL